MPPSRISRSTSIASSTRLPRFAYGASHHLNSPGDQPEPEPVAAEHRDGPDLPRRVARAEFADRRGERDPPGHAAIVATATSGSADDVPANYNVFCFSSRAEPLAAPNAQLTD